MSDPATEPADREMNMLVRDRTAFHEAGHVVVGLAVGYEVRRAWLVDERSGLTCFTESSPLSQEAQLAMLTAGFRAEGMALKLSCVGSPHAFLRDVDDFLPLFEEALRQPILKRSDTTMIPPG
jgi:hypothetical protein